MDIATLGLRVDANGAVQEIRNFSGATDKAGASSDALTAKLKRQDQGLRAIAESGVRAADTGNKVTQSLIAQNGGMDDEAREDYAAACIAGFRMFGDPRCWQSFDELSEFAKLALDSSYQAWPGADGSKLVIPKDAN